MAHRNNIGWSGLAVLAWVALMAAPAAAAETVASKIQPVFGKFHHVGIPTQQKMDKEVYLYEGDVYATHPKHSPARIVWLRFMEYSPAPDELKKNPYIAFQVEDLDKALEGRWPVVEPFEAFDGMRMAFIQYEGGLIGLVEDKNTEPPQFGAFSHVGVPSKTKREKEKYVYEGDVYVTPFNDSPARVSWLRWMDYSPAPDILRNNPYIAFEVKDLHKALMGKEVVVEPLEAYDGMRIAFILHKGVLVGFVTKN